jgi:hypothetical protein
MDKMLVEDERDKNIRVFVRKQAIVDVKNLVCLKCSLFSNRIKKTNESSVVVTGTIAYIGYYTTETLLRNNQA